MKRRTRASLPAAAAAALLLGLPGGAAAQFVPVQFGSSMTAQCVGGAYAGLSSAECQVVRFVLDVPAQSAGGFDWEDPDIYRVGKISSQASGWSFWDVLKVSSASGIHFLSPLVDPTFTSSWTADVFSFTDPLTGPGRRVEAAAPGFADPGRSALAIDVRMELGGFVADGSGLQAITYEASGEAFEAGGGPHVAEWSTAGNVSATPEPVSMLLLGSGLAGVGLARRRRRDPEEGIPA